MTEYELYCDFKKAQKSADELEKTAKAIMKLAKNSMYNELNNIYTNWTGTASNEYQKNGQKIIDDLLNTSKSINAAADTIRRVAQRIYNAEMKAINLAKTRKYS